MSRVTDAEVKEILNTSITTTAFITAANLIVTNKLSASGLSAADLKEIERWLAAHLVCIRDPRVKSKSISDASVTFQGQTGLGLDHTSYGQQVKLLDTTGILANLGKGIGQMEALDF